MNDWLHNLVKTTVVFVIGLALGMLAEHHWRAGKDAVTAAKVADAQVLAIDASVRKQADQLSHRMAEEQGRSVALLADQRARAQNVNAIRVEISHAVFLSPTDARGCTDPLGSDEFERLYDAARQAGGDPAPPGSAAAR